MVPGKFRLGISKMVADHERSAGAHQVHLAGREGERIDHVVDDVAGQGTVEGGQVVQGGVEEGKVMELGSIAPRLASPRTRTIISRDRSTPTTRYPAESRASETRPGPHPASRILLPGGNPANRTSRSSAAGSLWTGARSNRGACTSNALASAWSWSLLISSPRLDARPPLACSSGGTENDPASNHGPDYAGASKPVVGAGEAMMVMWKMSVA